MMKFTRGVALAAAVVLAAAACSDDSTTTTTGTTAAPASSTTTSTAAPTIEPTDDTARLVETEYGTALAGGDGLVLYAFSNDQPGTSTCVSEGCVEKWPPVLVEGEITLGNGLDSALFTTIDRPDGTKQLAVADQPLYTMADDTVGTALCQGADDVWWLVNADGTMNKTT